MSTTDAAIGLADVGNELDKLLPKLNKVIDKVNEAKDRLDAFHADARSADIFPAFFKAIDYTMQGLKALDLKSQESMDILAKLQALMTTDLPGAAASFGDHFQFLIDSIKAGSLKMTDVLLDLTAVEHQLSLYGLTPAQMADVTKFMAAFRQRVIDLFKSAGGHDDGTGGARQDTSQHSGASGAGGSGGGALGGGSGGGADAAINTVIRLLEAKRR